MKYDKTFFADDFEGTAEAARELASMIAPGDFVSLEGDLGAGKTAFTQALASFLGVSRPVTSPTFCLVSEYPTEKFLFVHMDLYRLRTEDDVLSLGWEDYIRRNCVMAVEWPDRAGSLIPRGAWRVRMAYCAGNPSARKISISRDDAE